MDYRIWVDPDKLRMAAKEFETGAETVRNASRRMRQKWHRVDYEARSRSGLDGRVEDALTRAETMATEADARAQFLVRVAGDFEKADQGGVLDCEPIRAGVNAVQAALYGGLTGDALLGTGLAATAGVGVVGGLAGAIGYAAKGGIPVAGVASTATSLYGRAEELAGEVAELPGAVGEKVQEVATGIVDVYSDPRNAIDAVGQVVMTGLPAIAGSALWMASHPTAREGMRAIGSVPGKEHWLKMAGYSPHATSFFTKHLPKAAVGTAGAFVGGVALSAAFNYLEYGDDTAMVVKATAVDAGISGVGIAGGLALAAIVGCPPAGAALAVGLGVSLAVNMDLGILPFIGQDLSGTTIRGLAIDAIDPAIEYVSTTVSDSYEQISNAVDTIGDTVAGLYQTASRHMPGVIGLGVASQTAVNAVDALVSPITDGIASSVGSFAQAFGL